MHTGERWKERARQTDILREMEKEEAREKWMKGRNFREREGGGGGWGGGREKWMKGMKERGGESQEKDVKYESKRGGWGEITRERERERERGARERTQTQKL